MGENSVCSFESSKWRFPIKVERGGQADVDYPTAGYTSTNERARSSRGVSESGVSGHSQNNALI
jgi:hypothetical protein